MHLSLNMRSWRNVTKVTYDNGVVIYVNYSEQDQTVDGVTVSALSYKVGEAG